VPLIPIVAAPAGLLVASPHVAPVGVGMKAMSDITIIHGDCLERMREIPDGSVSLVATDPPYGVEYHHGNQSKGGRSPDQVEWGTILGDDKPDGRWLCEAHRVMCDGAAIYLVTRWDVEPEWRRLLAEANFRVNQRLTWHKRSSGKGDIQGTYSPTCEDVLFASKGRHVLNHRPSMLLDVGCVPTWEKRFHPHQKPVALFKGLIEASTKHGDLVLDPFVGSGSTLVACMKTGRRGIGIELDERYITVIERRVKAAETPLFAALEADSCPT
jgi:DNA modification methylase